MGSRLLFDDQQNRFNLVTVGLRQVFLYRAAELHWRHPHSEEVGGGGLHVDDCR